MYGHDMSGLDWLWGSFMMGFGVVVIGVVVYIAVRLAQGDRERKGHT